MEPPEIATIDLVEIIKAGPSDPSRPAVLILCAQALMSHFQSIGMSAVKGFHYMDINDNKRVNAKEIAQALQKAGIQISASNTRNMIQGYVRPGGEMDVPGYLRFMQNAGK